VCVCVCVCVCVQGEGDKAIWLGKKKGWRALGGLEGFRW